MERPCTVDHFGSESEPERPNLRVVPDHPLGDVPNETVAMLRKEMQDAVADIEFRLAQQYELMRRQETGQMSKVYAEDMADSTHRLTGYTLTSNSPTSGVSISWANLHVVLDGVDYTIAAGNTSNKFVWFIKPGSYTPPTPLSLNTGDTVPPLGPKDCLLFVNNAGVASIPQSGITHAVGADAVGQTQIADNAVGQAQLASDVDLILTNIQNDLTSVEQQVDGAITSYFQDTAPWPAGSAAPSGAANEEMGDIWYDSNDGGAFRWSGTLGTPTPNAWVRIADTDTSSIAALAGSKITTYGPTTTAPTVPAGGAAAFTVGDIWLDSSAGATAVVMKRWTGSAWTAFQLGDGAIGGVGAGKVTGTLATGNIPTLDLLTKTTGTLTAARVGSGVNGAILTTATGTVGETQIGVGAVTASRQNVATHILY